MAAIIFGGIERKSLLKADGLIFDGTQLFDVILNLFNGFNFQPGANFNSMPAFLAIRHTVIFDGLINESWQIRKNFTF